MVVGCELLDASCSFMVIVVYSHALHAHQTSNGFHLASMTSFIGVQQVFMDAQNIQYNRKYAFSVQI